MENSEIKKISLKVSHKEYLRALQIVRIYEKQESKKLNKWWNFLTTPQGSKQK